MLYWALYVILKPVVLLVFRPQSEGLRNLPARGPVIIASNHLSWLDWIVMPLLLPRRVCFLAKAEYFTEPGLKGRLKRWFFAGTGQVPIERTGGAASAAALETGRKVLAAGRVLGLYPEGTRSPDGRLHRGRTGVARVALESGAPVVPVAMIGLFEVAPPGRIVPRVGRVGCRLGPPLDLRGYAGADPDGVMLRAVTDQLMREIQLLSGQEYVDRYAEQTRADLRAAGDGAVSDRVG